jgi:hypothetical protein
MIEALRKVIKRLHYPLEVMLTCVRWKVADQPGCHSADAALQEHVKAPGSFASTPVCSMSSAAMVP